MLLEYGAMVYILSVMYNEKKTIRMFFCVKGLGDDNMQLNFNKPYRILESDSDPDIYVTVSEKQEYHQ